MSFPANIWPGPIELELARPLVRVALAAPPVTAAEAAAVNTVFERDLPELALARPRTDIVEEVRSDPPVPALRLVSRERGWGYWGPSPKEWDRKIDLALLGILLRRRPWSTPTDARNEARSFEEGRIVVRSRNRAAERAARKRLEAFGLHAVNAYERAGKRCRPDDLCFRRGTVGLAGLCLWRRAGSSKAKAGASKSRTAFATPSSTAAANGTPSSQQADGWWFSLDLGIEVDGERVALLPVLTSLLARLRDLGKLRESRRAGAQRHRLRQASRRPPRGASARAHQGDPGDPRRAVRPGNGRRSRQARHISAGELAGLAAVEAATQLRWLGGERLRALAERLSRFSRIDKIEPPAGLQTELRPYQREGLDWLQFLRAYELGGILADDMGLGKTVQTLGPYPGREARGPARPAVPGRVPDQRGAELARGGGAVRARAARCCRCTAPDRAQRFGEIGNADLVITTYALLARDADQLLPVALAHRRAGRGAGDQEPDAKTTQLACRLEARHRLCLTGTPIENHLGELWSLFAFLMPGLLGDRQAVRPRVPHPDREEAGRRPRAQLLAGGVEAVPAAPDQGAGGGRAAAEDRDRPRRSSWPGAQRDLYETVRLAMHEQVRARDRRKGLARSHIVILDALLKLRQVCCDPRLLKLAAARRVTRQRQARAADGDAAAS